MVFKININHISAKNINANFVENPRYYPNSLRAREEILAIQKHHLFRKFPKLRLKNMCIERRKRSWRLGNKILSFNKSPTLVYYFLLSCWHRHQIWGGWGAAPSWV